MRLQEKFPKSKSNPKNIARRMKKSKQREADIKKRAANEKKIEKQELVYQMLIAMRQHFPELLDWMREVDDCRSKASEYELAAHLTACLAMFLFKSGSRNQYNQYREDVRFKRNFKRIFGFDMPHGDSVHNVIQLLDVEQIEQLKHKMVQVLLQRRTFHPSRYRDQWFRIAVDATGIGSYDHQRDDQCLYTTSKKGKKTWFHSVLEARLVTPQGFSVSIATVWIENPEDGEYDKQDCERKAFPRLAAKLKAQYPRLPMLILADGLYPYEGFFAICEANQWAFCVTFKEGNLPSAWKKVEELKPLQVTNNLRELIHLANGKIIENVFGWVTGVNYKGHIFNWLECLETVTTPNSDASKVKSETTRFVQITSLPINASNIVETSLTGRLRWKIENEGFNTLKNGGYEMEHQYARKSYIALKNYFQFMQMAHLIHQLMTINTRFQENFMKTKNHPTLKNLWRDLVAAMQWFDFDEQELEYRIGVRQQFRFST